MAGKKCAICKKPSGMYPLCSECFKLRDNGKAEKCDNCGKWYFVDVGCNCKKEEMKVATKDVIPCQICSSESANGELCENCIKEKAIGNIKLCDKCGKYYRSATRCECTFTDFEKSFHEKICPNCGRTYPGATTCHRGCNSETIKIDKNDEESFALIENEAKNALSETNFKEDKKFEKVANLTNNDEKKCSKCGRPSGDFDICYVCYRKKIEDDMKRDIETLIESEKDSGVDIRKKWPAKIRTQNGQYVRSHAECRIADWLAKNEITYEYERMVVSKKNKNRYLLCDFYLPRADVYIEYWGYKDKETYTKRRNEKIDIYSEKGFIMLDIENEHLESLDDSLRQLLCEYYEKL